MRFLQLHQEVKLNTIIGKSRASIPRITEVDRIEFALQTIP